MNKLLKVFTFCLIMAICASFLTPLANISHAAVDSTAGAIPASGGGASGDFDWKTSITDFEKSKGNDKANAAAKNVAGAFAVMVKIAGVGIAMVMLIVLAMKYMMAAPGDKAEIKKHAGVYVVGAVILFAATQIIAIIAEFSINIKTSE